MILSEELRDNFIIYFSIWIISVIFCGVLRMRSKVNLAFSGVFQKFLIHTETSENAWKR